MIHQPGVLGLAAIAKWHFGPKEVFADIEPVVVRPDPALVSVAAERLHIALQLNSQSGTLQTGISPADADLILRQAVYNARASVEKSNGQPLKNENMYSACGFVSAVAYWTFESGNINSREANLGDMAPKDKELRHAITLLIVPVNENGQVTEKLYMLDISYKQFCTVAHLPPRLDRPNTATGTKLEDVSGYYLNKTEDGKILAIDLLRHGFTELTPEKAKLYMDSFNYGDAMFERPEQYMAAFLNAPHDTDWTPEELFEKGHITHFPGGKQLKERMSADYGPDDTPTVALS